MMDMKTMKLRPMHRETGDFFRWELYRDALGWHLRTHDGCERFAGENYLSSVPFVRMVAENYGCEIVIS